MATETKQGVERYIRFNPGKGRFEHSAILDMNLDWEPIPEALLAGVRREFYEQGVIHGGVLDTLPVPSLDDILEEVGAELDRAAELGFGPFQSAHEGFAVLLEEVDELKAHVWTKQKNRDLPKMRKEAIEVAAMAVKFVQSLDAGNGRQ